MKGIESLLKQCDLFRKNQEALGFTFSVAKQDGTLRFSTNVDKKYKASFNRLVRGLLLDAARAALSMDSSPEWEEAFLRDEAAYYNILLHEGADAFLVCADCAVKRLHLARFLTGIHPCYEDGKTVYRSGDEVYADGTWSKRVQGGTEYRTSPVDWTALLP